MVQDSRTNWCVNPPCCSSECEQYASCHRSHRQAGRDSPEWTTHLQVEVSKHKQVITIIKRYITNTFCIKHIHKNWPLLKRNHYCSLLLVMFLHVTIKSIYVLWALWCSSPFYILQFPASYVYMYQTYLMCTNDCKLFAFVFTICTWSCLTRKKQIHETNTVDLWAYAQSLAVPLLSLFVSPHTVYLHAHTSTYAQVYIRTPMHSI